MAGMRIRRTKIEPDESKPWQNARIARPLRIALDLIFRHAPRLHSTVGRLRMAVPDLDMFLRRNKIKIDALKAECRRRRNWGVRLGRLALELVDPKTDTRPKSELRTIMRFGGLRPTPQLSVHKNGEFLGHANLALEAEKVAVEYDGGLHDDPARRRHDKKRRQRLGEAGWKFVIVRPEHLATDHRVILKRIQLARQRA
ncbi:DUF559 domain-containing protein [Amycolatopsis albispora]|uniref:DUF559 domain-containing protein n=1 Tax=Amycolatopsis albispora TaxID=1804986 RepID=UPI003001997F